MTDATAMAVTSPISDLRLTMITSTFDSGLRKQISPVDGHALQPRAHALERTKIVEAARCRAGISSRGHVGQCVTRAHLEKHARARLHTTCQAARPLNR